MMHRFSAISRRHRVTCNRTLPDHRVCKDVFSSQSAHQPDHDSLLPSCGDKGDKTGTLYPAGALPARTPQLPPSPQKEGF